MESLNEIKERMQTALPEAALEILPNEAVPEQSSLRVDAGHLSEAARFLRDDPALQLDFASNVTGIDWLDRVEKTKTKVKKVVDGKQKEVEETEETSIPGCLEVVYHLYSMRLKHGPVVLRVRTANRSDQARVPSLTSIWRSCEFQEREVYDLFGVDFTGHPDLRRILMWDEFEDYPMRKDYVEPDDYEYEPTPHGDVLEKAKKHGA